MLLAAVLAGNAGWATDLPVWARPRLGITKGAPSLSTIRRALLLVDPDVLDAVLHAWLAALAAPSEAPESLRAVAVDGKTCRGARTSGETRMHLFSAVDHATGIPLGQVLVEPKGREIAAFAGGVGPDRPVRGGGHRGRAAYPAAARVLPAPTGHVFIANRNQAKLHDRLA